MTDDLLRLRTGTGFHSHNDFYIASIRWMEFLSFKDQCATGRPLVRKKSAKKEVLRWCIEVLL